ncbi:hypothetical protein PFZ49_01110 [Microbacterium lacticum]|uniref:hypothetical protein n=1 Tax=Microbacterium lacticum TaxID=33885 RepID=UPI003A88DDB1
MDDTTRHEIAGAALDAAHTAILRGIMSTGSDDADLDALLIAADLRGAGDALILWRAAVLLAQGETKRRVAELLGYANTSNFNRQYPEINTISSAVRRAIIREERTVIDVRGYAVTFDPSTEPALS